MNLDKIKKELSNGEAILLDVREKRETDLGLLPNALLVPFSHLERGDYPHDLPKDKIIYIYCRSGGRAIAAAEMLKDDYSHVVPLKFTFEELKKEL